MFRLTFLFWFISLVTYGQLTERESKVLEEVKNVCCYIAYTNNKDIFTGNNYKEAHLHVTMLANAIARAGESIAYEIPELGTLEESDWEKIVTGFFIAYTTSEDVTSDVTPSKAARSFAEINSYGQFETEEGMVYTELEALYEYWLKRYTIEIKQDFSIYIALKLVELAAYGGKVSISDEIQEYLNSDRHKFAIQKGVATVR